MHRRNCGEIIPFEEEESKVALVSEITPHCTWPDFRWLTGSWGFKLHLGAQPDLCILLQPVQERIVSSAVASDGKVFFATTRGMQALDGDTGRHLWTFDARCAVGDATPVVDHDSLFFAGECVHFHPLLYLILHNPWSCIHPLQQLYNVNIYT